MGIDMGAVGKGIALDLLWNLCEAGEYGSVSGTVSVGGSIAVYAAKPDNTAWKLGIQNPRGQTGEVMGVYESNAGCFLSTSGDYEKYFEEDGKRYHHILDPSTGYPADNGLISVTIIIPMTDASGADVSHENQGLLTDALSTACFILGRDDGMKLAQEYGAQAIFIDRDYNVYTTDGLKKSFQITDETYKDASME
jgi:thiamine biosynthesis lipoprotein